MTDKYKDKCQKLEAMLTEYTREDVIIAFSGGVDSSLLLGLCCEAAKRQGTCVYAVTVQTRLHPKGDLKIAKRVAAEMGAVLKILEIDELSETGIENNPKDRCYRCKKGIFQKILELAKNDSISLVLEGTNEDDLHHYRPGIRALKELGIVSPLALCHFTKEEVRRLAGEHGISVANRPSNPCMATRLPYGAALDYKLLNRIEQGEEFIRTLGFYNVRLRVHGDIARVEVDVQDFFRLIEKREFIAAYIKSLGFRYVTMDLEGFRSGSMDE